MQTNYQQQDGRRVRNVPIHIERETARSPRDNSEQKKTQHQNLRYHSGDGDYSNDYDGEPQDNHWHRSNQSHLNEPNSYNHRTSPHTSSININYKPQPYPHNDKQQQGDREYNGDARANGSPQEPHTRQTNQSSRLNSQQQSDKENSESFTASNSSNECATNEKNRGESEDQRPSPIPPVIPLPPPPSLAKSEGEKSNSEERGQNQPAQQQQNTQQQHQQQGHDEQSKKVKQETGPLAVINATKAEVNRLLQEVANCAETSIKSKEFLRLEELLTLCILKLDDIQTSEWRQQRKEVINMINKCTDILERKINLNNDIQQLAASCS